MYNFPKNLFTDVRIERHSFMNFSIKDGEVTSSGKYDENGAFIRIFDGEMQYTTCTNDLQNIQREIDNLAALAKENKDIYSDPVIKNFGDSKAEILKYEGDEDIRKISPEKAEALVRGYIDSCYDNRVTEIKSCIAGYSAQHTIKEYYSGKGASVKQDIQRCKVYMSFDFSVNDTPWSVYKTLQGMTFDSLLNREKEITEERDRYLDYAKNAVDVTPGEYTCVLAPSVTALFTHESFGHKSESDYMMNDKTLQQEWKMGKKVGSEKVTICDNGLLDNNGYVPFDDEGNRAEATYLIKNGVLTGRLHDSKSAAALGEKVTGNSRSQSYEYSPMVRMTNTFMEKGSDSPEDIIKGVKDGIYVYGVNYGTGCGTFTMQPYLCYRIRDGKIAEPVRVNVITGSVFKALFDIDAVGDDFEIFDAFTCGKGGQTVHVSTGGATIRVKSLTVN